jgi:hypothetical protein
MQNKWIRYIISQVPETTVCFDVSAYKISLSLLLLPPHGHQSCLQDRFSLYIEYFYLYEEGADKSLARPERKQVTATKFGIYSTYSPRRSIHALARCSNVCKPLNKIQKIIHPTRSLRQEWHPCRTNNGDLSIVVSVQGTGGSPKGPNLENWVGDQDTGSPGRPVTFVLQVHHEPGHCRARTRPPLVTFPRRGVFPSKCS